MVRPLFYALRYARSLLGTPVPDEVLDEAAAVGQPSSPILRLMDALFKRGLTPDHESCRDRFTGIAKWMLYVRSHYLRMPLHLLLPHLFHKAFITPITERRAEKAAAERPTIQKLLAQRRR